MNVIIGTDIEGVAGITSFESEAYDTGRYYDRAKRLLTAEINAAVEGALEAGAKDILVVDGHGPGGVFYDDLHDAAKLLHGRPSATRDKRAEITKRYDVCFMIGQHAMAATEDGTLNHTQSSKTVEYYALNGKPIGEIAQFALYHGAFGVPLVFLSGDVAACREVEELVSGITTAAVKEGLSRQSAISLSSAASHRLIRERAATALKRHTESPLEPVVWEPPYLLEKRFLLRGVVG